MDSGLCTGFHLLPCALSTALSVVLPEFITAPLSWRKTGLCCDSTVAESFIAGCQRALCFLGEMVVFSVMLRPQDVCVRIL